MSTSLVSLTALTGLASNLIFSPRRLSRGVDSMEENPLYATMNINLAAAQALKCARAMKEVSATGNNNYINELLTNASKNNKILANNKVLKSVGKVVDVTSKHVNPFICATSAIKVIGSDDKLDTAARESMAISTMFAFEGAAKEILGMSNKIKGKPNVKFSKLFKSQQLGMINDYKLVTKYLKYATPIVKGVGFALASIMGYKTGAAIANGVLGDASNS